MSNNVFELVETLRVAIDQLNQVLIGDSTATVTIDGVTKPSISNAINSAFAAIQAALTGRRAYLTKALMDADLAHPADTLAEVWYDPTPANNGLYGKTGASGSGSWVKSLYDVSSKVSNLGVVVGAGKVTINRQTQQVIVPAGGVYAVAPGRNSFYLLPAQTVNTTAGASGITTFYFDRSTKAIGAVGAGPDAVPENAVVFAWDFNGKLFALDDRYIAYTSASGAVLRDTATQQVGFLVALGSKVTINRQTQQVVVPASVCGQSPYGMFSVPAQTLNLTANPGNLTAFYYNTVTQLIGVAEATTVPPDCIVFAWDFNGKLFALDASAITYANASGVVPASLSPFEEAKHRLLLPKKMYFVAGKPLPLYKSSVVSALDTDVLDNLKLTLMPNAAAGGIAYAAAGGRYQYFLEDVQLDPAVLGPTFAIGMKQNYVATTRYLATLSREVAPADALSGKVLKFVCIGDSLTESGMSNVVAARLTALGATAASLGSYAGNAYQLAGTKTEGRSNWTFRTFIGKDNVTGADVVAPAPDGLTGRGQNPFQKRATEDDKAAHPDWCFRSTGSNSELSYADDPVKTGDFYIFDFANYLAKHGVDQANPIPTPDFVTIGLSTNDLWLNGGYEATWVQWCRTALDIMVRQIAAAAPNCKIGIIPTPGWGSTANGNAKNAALASWIELCLEDVGALAASGFKVSVIPVWAHFNRDWNFPTDFSALSADNYTLKGNVLDDVHFWGGNTIDKTLQGSMEYGDVVEAWVANQFKA